MSTPKSNERLKMSSKLVTKTKVVQNANVFTKIPSKKLVKIKEEKMEDPPGDVIPPNILKIKLDVKDKIKRYFKEKAIIKD